MIYVSADLHGRFDCLTELLDAAHFSERDWLYIIGDVIDRNCDGGVKILKWLLLQPNVQLILGNHESVLLANRWLFGEVTDESVNALDESALSLFSEWMKNGGEVTVEHLARESSETREDILAYLEDCPLYEWVAAGGRKYLLVHGGLGNFEKGRPIEDYSPDELLWCRPNIDDEYSPAEYTVVLGHTPTCSYSKRYKNRMIRTKSYLNIDTGAAFPDGKPMLFCLDTQKEYYIEDGGVVSV